MQALLPFRMLASLSARGRLIALALIPIIALAAIGGAYMAGEVQIAAAFHNMNRAAALVHVAPVQGASRTNDVVTKASTHHAGTRPRGQREPQGIVNLRGGGRRSPLGGRSVT